MTLTNKILMFVVVCLFAVGQTNSLAMACDHQMIGDNSISGVGHMPAMVDMNDHMHHNMGHDLTQRLTKDTTASSSDCCGADCACPAGMCASIALSECRSNSNNFKLNPRILADNGMLPNDIAATLFRPPIFALV